MNTTQQLVSKLKQQLSGCKKKIAECVNCKRKPQLAKGCPTCHPFVSLSEKLRSQIEDLQAKSALATATQRSSVTLSATPSPQKEQTTERDITRTSSEPLIHNLYQDSEEEYNIPVPSDSATQTILTDLHNYPSWDPTLDEFRTKEPSRRTSPMNVDAPPVDYKKIANDFGVLYHIYEIDKKLPANLQPKHLEEIKFLCKLVLDGGFDGLSTDTKDTAKSRLLFYWRAYKLGFATALSYENSTGLSTDRYENTGIAPTAATATNIANATLQLTTAQLRELIGNRQSNGGWSRNRSTSRSRAYNNNNTNRSRSRGTNNYRGNYRRY